jgi:hypothetical protein
MAELSYVWCWKANSNRFRCGKPTSTKIWSVVFVADTGNAVANQFAGFGLSFEPEAHVVVLHG